MSGDYVLMRHVDCGRVAMKIRGEVVDNPKRAIMADDVLLAPDWTPAPAGVPLTCHHCGQVIQIGPRGLEIDRGPDARESPIQRMALKVAKKILPQPKYQMVGYKHKGRIVEIP